MNSNKHVKILSGTASLYLAGKIAKKYGSPLGNVTIDQYSDGEIQPNIQESIRGCYTFLIQSTFPPADNLMELMLLIDAAKRASADYIVAVIPYFGYARQDRKDKPRVPIAARLVADLISTAGANRIMTMDLHAPQIQGFFNIPVDHLDGMAVFGPYLRSLNLEEGFIFASPDLGSVKRVRSYANRFHTEMVICDKYRKRANEITSMRLIGNVEGKHVILIDDMIDTGGTLASAADLIMEKGALSVRALCTHPVLSGNAHHTIEQSSLTELVVCNTIPIKQKSPKIKVLSVAELFAKTFKYIHENRSISTLFE